MSSQPTAHTPTRVRGEIHDEGTNFAPLFSCTFYFDALCTKPSHTVYGATFEECEANAALIVRACNTHAELVAALEHARALVASRDVVLDRAALKMYDAALAKAKA